MGDFNVILSSNDTLMGNHMTQGETEDFSDCIQQLSLRELSLKGDFFTWKTNYQRRIKYGVCWTGHLVILSG